MRRTELAYLVPFLSVEPDLAVKETRTVTLFAPREGIPAGEYGFVECYCPDPDCNCRSVLIEVVAREHPTRVLAAISLKFDRDAEYAGPFLDPMNAQGPYADALLRLFIGVALSDPAYLARLERHYDQVKRAARDPAHPAYDRLRQATDSDGGWISVREMDALLGKTDPGPAPAPVGRNDPCPCGSGKKYKHCCGAPAANPR
jgi:hypothetical protein